STCQLTFGPTDLYAISDTYTAQLAAGDFNGDGLSDLAVSDYIFPAVSVFLGISNGSFEQEITYSAADSQPYWLTVADFNNDDYLDIFVMSDNTYNVSILFGNGSETFEAMIVLPVISSIQNTPCSIASDLNSDGNIDIVFTKNDTPCTMGILLGYGNGSFADETIISIGNDKCMLSFAIADFNDDDHQDIAVTVDVNYHVAVLLGYGNGSFTIPMTFSTGIYSFPSSMHVNDFNGDGYIDIVVANQGNYNIGVLLGKGDGNFGTQITTMTGPPNIVIQIAVGDYNGDGKMDVAGVCGESSFSLYPTPTFVIVFVGYGNGSFGQQMIFSTELVSLDYVLANDFNGDGRLDLAIGSSNGGNFGIVLNTCACC
ncbi:unnamed protein product, partial [Adineta steineri]